MRLGSIQALGALQQLANTGIIVGIGNTAQRVANAGTVRLNTDLTRFETYNGSAWSNIGTGDGSVTSVGLSSGSTGLVVSNSPVTTSGTISITLGGELAGLNGLSTTGLVARTGAATYTTYSITASAAAGLQGINVTNGSNAPVIGMSISGLTAAGALSNTVSFPVFDGTNNTKATMAQVATLMDTFFISQGGDTMTGTLTLAADPVSALQASTKSYVDNAVANAIAADTYTATANGGLLLTGKAFSANTTGVSTGLVAGNIAVRSTATTGQTLLSTGTAGAEATWGALNLASSSAVTGALAVVNGGTGATTAPAALVNLGALPTAGGTMTGTLTLAADPAAALQAATKSYVDNTAAYTAAANGGLTLTAKAFSANTTSVTTGLVAGKIAVISTATAGQVMLSTGTAAAEGSWGAITLSNANSVTGALGVVNGGTGATTAAAARTNLSAAGVYRTSFTSASLTGNLLTVTHNLGSQFCHVVIYDNNNLQIQPDNITATSTTVATIDFTSFSPLTGTWNVVVIG